MAGTLLFDEKIRQRVTLFWFGLWNDEISPAFMGYGLAKKIAV
jgi:hypothetical protein